MLNQSRRIEIQTLLARQIGHLTRSGESLDAACDKLRDAVDGELKGEVEELRRRLSSGDEAQKTERRFASPLVTLSRLAATARRNGADTSKVLSHAEEVLGPLGEAYRVYWSGIGGVLGYALALTVMMSIVLGVFSIFVFPQLEGLFEGNEDSLPALTQATMDVLNRFRDLFFFAIAAGIVGLAIAAHKIRDAMKRLEPLRGVMVRIPGLGTLCESYNRVLLLSLSRLLMLAGMKPEDALDELSHITKPASGRASSATLDGLARVDPINAALVLARRTGTLDVELEHLSARAHSIFSDRLAKVREEFTLVAQVTIGLVIATLVISMYLPIFKMGTIF